MQGALQYKLTRTARRCVRGGARSCSVRQTDVLKRGSLCWSCVVRRPCIVRSCIEYPWEIQAKFWKSALNCRNPQTTLTQPPHRRLSNLCLPPTAVLSDSSLGSSAFKVRSEVQIYLTCCYNCHHRPLPLEYGFAL